MNTQITRLEYEAPKLEVQELLPLVHATCPSGPSGDVHDQDKSCDNRGKDLEIGA